MARAFDCGVDVLGDCRRELYEFAARALEREAMLVFAARGIRAERRNAAAALDFERLRPPGARRAVRFGRHPLLDVPAIHRRIFRLLAQFDDFAKQRARRGIALLEFSANPRQPLPSPNRAIVRLAKTIDTAGQLETMRDACRSVVRFAQNRNHGGTSL